MDPSRYSYPQQQQQQQHMSASQSNPQYQYQQQQQQQQQQRPPNPSFNPNLQLPQSISNAQTSQQPNFNPNQQAQAQQYAIQQQRLALQQQQQLQQAQAQAQSQSQSQNQSQPGNPSFPNYQSNASGANNGGAFVTASSAAPALTQPAPQNPPYGNANPTQMQHAAAMMQQQMQQPRPAGVPQYYTSGPSTQASPATASPVVSAQTLNALQARQAGQSGGPAGPIQQPTIQRPNTNSPNTMVSAQSLNAGQTPGSGPQPQPPQQTVIASSLSPENALKEKERVGVLFEINAILLQELITMQSQGKGGNMQPNTTSTEPGKEKMAQQDFLEYMRRFQGNLTYLAADAERHSKPPEKMPSGPTYMTAPPVYSSEQATAPAMTQLVALYSRLQQLFPGWKGKTDVQAMIAQTAAARSAAAAAAS